MARTTNKRNAVVLAKGLSLPPDAATQTFLIVGKRGSGKSTTAVRMAEQLHAAGVPFVVIDPVDTWWGLKADRGDVHDDPLVYAMRDRISWAVGAVVAAAFLAAMVAPPGIIPGS